MTFLYCPFQEPEAGVVTEVDLDKTAAAAGAVRYLDYFICFYIHKKAAVAGTMVMVGTATVEAKAVMVVKADTEVKAADHGVSSCIQN